MNQVFQAHGLGQEERAAASEPAFAGFALRDSRRQENDGRSFQMPIIADLRGHISAVHGGHNHVQQDQIRLELPSCRQGVSGSILFLDLEGAGFFQVQLHHACETGFIVDDQDSFFFHIAPIFCARRCVDSSYFE